MKNKNGITLIALVITIVILVILAGVAINLTVGENGLLRKAKLAKEEYNNAVTSEEEQLNELYAYLTSGDLPENTKENPQDVVTIVKLPANWETITPCEVSLTDGSIVTASAKVASVYAVSVGQGETVPVPKGFYYVGGTLDTGVVISDKEADSYLKNKRDMSSHEDAINLIGNQFVWIPCNKKNYVKGSWSKGDISYWDTITNGAELTQIEKYEGFYVSRYEAGLPVGTTEIKDKEQNTGSNPVYNTVGVPQSKAGISPWNFIDWNKSQQSAQKMYEKNIYVSSSLITGTQWDVMITKIGSLTDNKGNTLYSLTDSASWGNYYTGDTNGFTFRGDVSEYKSGYQYAFTAPTSTTKANSTYYLLKTGASSHNLAYNLYDVAGNLWEWTEENAYYDASSDLSNNRVLRGGAFSTNSSTESVCCRDGSCSNSGTSCSMGFRIVLYMR